MSSRGTRAGGKGIDSLDGGDGNDQLRGGPGVNTLIGEAGNDTLFAVNGLADSLSGGSGNNSGELDMGIDIQPSDIQTLLA